MDTSISGARLSAGHQGVYSVVQDTDSIPEHIWTFVSVSYDASSGTMTLYKNGEQVDQATDVPLQDEVQLLSLDDLGMGIIFMVILMKLLYEENLDFK